MVSAPKKWRRWCGPRSELVRATELAADELRTWSGLTPKVDVRIEDHTGLTETKPDAGAIMDLHADDLRHIESVIVTVRLDREAWWRRRDEERENRRERNEPPQDYPPLPDDEVSIRVTKYGTTLEVDGEHRTSVEGLRQRLSEVLGRAATNVLDRGWVLSLGLLAVTLCVIAAIPMRSLRSSSASSSLPFSPPGRGGYSRLSRCSTRAARVGHGASASGSSASRGRSF
jgi:hypothetical protein